MVRVGRLLLRTYFDYIQETLKHLWSRTVNIASFLLFVLSLLSILPSLVRNRFLEAIEIHLRVLNFPLDMNLSYLASIHSFNVCKSISKDITSQADNGRDSARDSDPD